MSRVNDKTPEETRVDAGTFSTPATGQFSSPESSTFRVHALVISDNAVATCPLPDHGDVTIGRGPQCELVINDPSISRAHAVLTLGPAMTIRDLKSANGTRVRGLRLAPEQPAALVFGEAIQVGSATVIVQRQAAPMRPRRLWTHDYFEVRLEEECARASRQGLSFTVMRLACSASVSPEVIQHAVADIARQSDVVGQYGPTDYEVLLVGAGAEEVELAVNRYVTGLEQHGISVRVGTASYPRDGRNADELMSLAEASARGTRADAQRNEIVAEQTMRDLYSLAARVASGKISVLILGETGVGKEVLAEEVHKKSPRAGKPYLRLNCAALSETLLESELFGHERGAFTGAIATKQGLLETADGGSIFLDEIGEMPMSIQVKLLRVIEERVVTRVGGLKPRALDVRFIAATNRDLEAEVARGSFRQDLFFRLNGATLVIPPLRERPGEISALAHAFLAHAARDAGLTHAPELSQEVLDALLRYSWPGNIRELRNTIERAVLLCGDGPRLLARHLPLEKMRVTFAASAAAMPSLPLPLPPPPPDLPPTVVPRAKSDVASDPAISVRRGLRLSEAEERAQIESALLACGGNQTRAAKMLGIGRRTLINRVKAFGLARPHGKP